ncbi:hypothetical protein Gotri_006516 [Gossypium trilobum]|uniref:Uncharacterized protein n=1 Tax=Gossypium trilobum TaxID=34281 RepID=A0A7J9F051_9ROSI|nr:hypothetical protein [Gossypium trilobum]
MPHFDIWMCKTGRNIE